MLISNNTDAFAQYAWLMPVIIIASLWSFVWKALSLYRAGFNHSPGWFIALLIFNTLGILDILYIFVFGKKKS
jgi:hypothetical protein